MTTKKLSEHIYNYVLNSKKITSEYQKSSNSNDQNIINYVSNLIELHLDESWLKNPCGFIQISEGDLN